MKFNQDDKVKIKCVKDIVKSYQNEADYKFKWLCKDLRVDKDTEEWLYDYIYNNFGTLKLIETKGSIKVK